MPSILASPRHAFIAAIGAFAALHAVSSLSMPLGWDHGMLASVGVELARGEMPYRDSWELKSPLAFLPYAVAYLLFGNVMWGVRLIDLAILVPMLSCFMRVVRSETDPVIGIGAALGLYLLFASQTWFFTGQPDPWAAMLVALATCSTLAKSGQARPEPSMYFLSGLLIGAAGLIKPVYLVFGLAPFISATFAPIGEAENKARVRDIVLLGAGTGCAILACVLYLALGGALGHAIEAQIHYNIGTYAKADGASLKESVRQIGLFFSKSTITLLVLISALALWTRRDDKIQVAQLIAWLFAALVFVIVQGKYYDSHWAGMFPPLMFCAAIGFHTLVNAIATAATGRVLGTMACALFFLNVSAEPAQEALRWGRHLLGSSRVDYYFNFEKWIYSSASQWLAAEHIRKNSGPNDGLFVWGNDATIHFLADRPNPTRFNFNLPLVLDGPYRAAYQAETMGKLLQAPPKFIVVGLSWEGVDKEASLARFPMFRDFLMRHYAFDVEYGSVHIYRLKGAPSVDTTAPAARSN
jgi:hypothetical protein